MDNFIIYLVERYGWLALGAGLLLYLLLESALDVISGLIGDWVRHKLGRS